MSGSTSCSKKWMGWGSSGRSVMGPGDPENCCAGGAWSFSGVVADHEIVDTGPHLLRPLPPALPPPRPLPLPCVTVLSEGSSIL